MGCRVSNFLFSCVKCLAFFGKARLETTLTYAMNVICLGYLIGGMETNWMFFYKINPNLLIFNRFLRLIIVINNNYIGTFFLAVFGRS